MKFCERCGNECCGRDGENRCRDCQCGKVKKSAAAAQRKARHEALVSCGLVRVRGALGGVYYE
jgi:hypothetical protein